MVFFSFFFGCFCWVFVGFLLGFSPWLFCSGGGASANSTMIGGSVVVVVVVAVSVNIQRNFDLFFIVLATETKRINLYTIFKNR